MKIKIPLSLLALTLLFFWSCDPIPPKLTIDSNEICLGADSTKNCYNRQGAYLWLHVDKGAVTLDAMPERLPANPVVWTQFDEPKGLDEGSYTVNLRNDSLILSWGNNSIYTLPQLGFIILVNPRGSITLLAATASECFRVPLTFGPGQISRNGADMGTAMTIRSEIREMDGDSTAIIDKIIEGDIAARTMQNDTGTEVVIVDGFRAHRNNTCCDGVGSTCCSDGKSANVRGDAADPIEAVTDPQLESYLTLLHNNNLAGVSMPSSLDDWKQVLNLDPESICVYEECHIVMVHHCDTGEVYCFDTTTCTLMIRLNQDGSVSFLVPNDCTAFDNMAPCS